MQQLQQQQDKLSAAMALSEEHAAVASRLLPQLQKQSEQMQAQLHDHTARLAAAADDLHSKLAEVQASAGVAAATAASQLEAAKAELKGAIHTQALATKGLEDDLKLLKTSSAAAAEAAAAKAAAAAAGTAALAVQLQEQQATVQTQLAALRTDLNTSVTNAKLEEELEFLSLHDELDQLAASLQRHAAAASAALSTGLASVTAAAGAAAAQAAAKQEADVKALAASLKDTQAGFRVRLRPWTAGCLCWTSSCRIALLQPQQGCSKG
jgi:chromosome segregation ATPase